MGISNSIFFFFFFGRNSWEGGWAFTRDPSLNFFGGGRSQNLRKGMGYSQILGRGLGEGWR